jgi:hypothetical protein
MLRVIASSSLSFRDAFVTVLALEKKEESPIATVYQKWGTIFLSLSRDVSPDTVSWMRDTFLPDRLYLTYSGYSVDVVHEIGDVIVPNVFTSHNKDIEKVEITEENRDSFMSDARFLEVFEEQKDYYVEDYGLSVGGIIVDSAPDAPSDELASRMMLAYEADVYVRETFSPAIDAVEWDDVPTMILVGVTRGKKNAKYPDEDPILLTVKNMVTTMKLMEDEEK